MAQNSAVHSTYDQIGLEEDVDDAIYNVDPVDTPMASRIKRGKATNTMVEWQTDTLAAAATNVQIEGDEITYVTSSATSRLRNYTQLFFKNTIVSDTSRNVATYGREDELEYQLAKRGKELKRDIEFAFTRNQKIDAGTDATGRQMGSIESWLSTNEYVANTAAANAGTTTPGYSSGTLAAPTDGSAMTTFLELHLRNAMRNIWNNGGEPSLMLVDGNSKSWVSQNFAGIADLRRETSGKRVADILGTADIYRSDFGVLEIVPDRHMRGRVALLLDMRYWRADVLQPIKIDKMAKTGHSERRLISTELTLCSLNERASGKIVDILDSY